jgi:hypothetical protein
MRQRIDDMDKTTSKHTLQHVMDWTTGEAYFAIVLNGRIVKRLDCVTNNEARAAYRAALAAAGVQS